MNFHMTSSKDRFHYVTIFINETFILFLDCEGIFLNMGFVKHKPGVDEL